MTTPPPPKLLLGVDAGGSSTDVAELELDPDGNVVAMRRATAGPGNPRDIGIDGFQRSLTTALHLLHPDTPRYDAAFLGIAGVVSKAERASITALAQELRLADQVEIDHDLRVAHAGALGGSPGIVVVAGTGSAAYARSADGRTARAGGWGCVLDDAGSAFDLGRGALSACLRALDRRGPLTILTQRIPPELPCQDWRDVLTWIHDPVSRRPEVAQLARVVIQAAEDGDPVAIDLIRSATDELATAAAAVAPVVNEAHPRIAVMGGLAQHSATGQSAGIWLRSWQRSVATRVPHARLSQAQSDPATGACLLAARRLGVSIEPSSLPRQQENQ